MMQRLAFLLVLPLCSAQSGVVAAQSTDHLRVANPSNQQRRELGMFSWWSTLLTHLHPCPPHHKNCHSNSSHNSNSNNSNNYNNNNYNSDGTDGDYEGISEYNYDGIENGDGTSGGEYTDDYELTYNQENAAGNGWESKNLDNGSGSFTGTHSGAASGIGMFLAAAMVAGVIGAAVMVARKRRENNEDEDDQDTRQNRMGAVRRRMRGKKNTLVDSTPAFVEITSVGNISPGSSRSNSSSPPGSPGSPGSDGSYVEMA